MGKSVARKGDAVFAEADSHPEKNAPPVPVAGNIIEGSPDTFTNNFPNARKGDAGVHVVCLGENTFEISAGSDRVFTNDKPQARAEDATTHCKATSNAAGKILNLTSPNSFA